MLEQGIIGSILLCAVGLFLWGRWRHDVVAMVTLLAAVLSGVVPVDGAFTGFGHPAVITVACVLVISRALEFSGAMDIAAERIAGISEHPLVNLILLTGVGALLSGFINNVGALALMMPLALRTARSPSAVLMPLSFGTILGGMMTEIGTPPNIIIAAYRQEVTGRAFSLFDFSPVGGVVALAGLVFLVAFGRHLIPVDRRGKKTPAEMLKDAEYLTEARVAEGSKAIGKTVRQLERMADNQALVVGIVRGERHFLGRLREDRLREGDIVILRAEVAAFQKLLEAANLELAGHENIVPENLRSENIALMEVVVMPGSRAERRSADSLGLRARYGINMLAVARQGRQIKGRLGHVFFQAGDVLLVQGETETLYETMAALDCLPLAERGLRPHHRHQRFLPLAIFAAAIGAVVVGVVPVQIAFTAAVAAMVLFKTITPREIYESIDWSVIVLLAALIPVGHALESTGVTHLLANGILDVARHMPAWGTLALFMTLVMILTNLINNAATAVIAAPVAVSLAHQIGAGIDPFLMATAIAASSAFLTPIGHQNNVLVMGPGGYHFGDFWRLGLPLQVLVLVLSVPLILAVWPL